MAEAMAMSDDDERAGREFEEAAGDGWECAHCGEWKVASRFDEGSLVCRACEDPEAAIAERFEAAIDDLDGGDA
jgi:hypothetical protein